MRTHEEDPHGDPNLKYPWLPEAGYKAKLVHYIAEAGAHARRHQRGTSDLKVCVCERVMAVFNRESPEKLSVITNTSRRAVLGEDGVVSLQPSRSYFT